MHKHHAFSIMSHNSTFVRGFIVWQVAWRNLSDDSFLTIGRRVWAFDTNILLEHLRKENGVTSWDLIFRQARPSLSGSYECQITSSVRHVRTVSLTVVGR